MKRRNFQVWFLAFGIIAFSPISWLTVFGLQDEVANEQADDTPRVDFIGDPLPPYALLRLGTSRFCPNDVYAIALSADQSIIVAYGQEISGWDAKSGKRLWTNPIFQNDKVITGSARYGYRSLCRMPVSGRLASPSSPGSVKLVDFATGEAVQLSTGAIDTFHSIDVSSDEKHFALGGPSMLIVCDHEGKESYRIENKPEKSIETRSDGDRLTIAGEFSYARFTPDGKSLLLVNSEKPKTIQVLDSVTGEVRQNIETDGFIIRIACSKDSKLVYATEHVIAARAYEIESGKRVWERKFSIPGLDERYTTDIAMSPTGDLLAVGTAIGEDTRIQLLNPADGEIIGELKGHTWKPWSLEFNADGSELYSAGWDGVIRRWDIAKREQVWLPNSERASSLCTIAPDGKTIVFGDDSGKLHFVDRATGKKTRTIEIEGTSFSELVYSQDGSRLAAGGSSTNDIHVFAWNPENGDELHHWDWPKGRDVHSSVEALGFSKDAERLAVAVFRQSQCYVFDLPSNKPLVQPQHRMVYGLCLNAEGTSLASAGWDKAICLWDCETGELRKKLVVEDADNANADTRMYGVLFSPDGQSIVTQGMDNMIRTWSTDLEPASSFRLSGGTVRGVFQFSKNGMWLGVGHASGKVWVYNLLDGEVVWDSGEHSDSVYSIDFGPNDQTLLTGGSDGVCYLWDLNSSGKEEVDFGRMARDLVGTSPRDAFVAHQRLASEPERAIPALRSVLEWLFGKPMEGDNADIQCRRIVSLLTFLETPGADELLGYMLEHSPNATIKKMVFLAQKDRKRYLERMSSH